MENLLNLYFKFELLKRYEVCYNNLWLNMLEEMKVKWNRRDLFSEEFVFRRFVRFSDDDSYKVFR